MTIAAEHRIRWIRADWAWSLTADMLMRVAPIIAVTVCFPLLGAQVAGSVLIALSYVIVLYMVVDLGLGLYGARAIAEDETDPGALHAEITVARLALLVPATALLLALLRGVVETSWATALAFGGYLISRGLSADWRLRGAGRFRTLAWINLTAAGLQLALLPLVVTQENWQTTVALPWLIGGLIMMTGTWCATGVAPARLTAAFRPGSLRHLASSYRFSLIGGAVTLFHHSPILLLSLVYSSGALAGFALAHRIALAVIMFAGSLGHVLLPRLVRASRHPGSGARDLTLGGLRAVGLMLGGMAPLGLALLLIDDVRNLYFPGVTGFVFGMLGLFAGIDSLRVVLMNLGFSRNQERRVMIVIFSALGAYIPALLALHLAGFLTIPALTAAFLATGLCLFIGIAILAGEQNPFAVTGRG